MAIRGILDSHVGRISDVKRRLNLPEKERSLAENLISPAEQDLISQPTFYNMIRMGLDEVEASRRNNANSVYDPVDPADKELKEFFLYKYKRIFLYNQANKANTDRFLWMLSSLADIVNFFNDYPVSDFKSQLPAPPMPEFATEWNGYSHFHVEPSDKNFLYYWVSDWLLYFFSFKDSFYFNRGKKDKYNLDLEPDGMTVILIAGLYSLLGDEEGSQYTDFNFIDSNQWKNNISVALYNFDPKFEKLIVNFSREIFFIKDNWKNTYEKEIGSELANIDTLDPIILKFVATVYYLAEEAFLGIIN